MSSFYFNSNLEQPASPLSESDLDALLQTVNEQITLHAFDFSDPQILQRMVQGLGDPREAVRSQVVELLGEIGEVATPFLIAKLTDPDPVVRRTAAKALTLIADPISIPSLLHAALQDVDATVRGLGIGALTRIGEASVPYLLNILESASYPESIKGYAAWALALIGPEAGEQLYRTLSSESVDVRCAGVSAIAHVAQEQTDERAFQALIAMLTDPDAVVRTTAVAALGQLKYKPAVPHLIMAIKDKDEEVRKAAVNALGRTGERASMVHLDPLLDDPAKVVQQMATLAIAQIDNSSETLLD